MATILLPTANLTLPQDLNLPLMAVELFSDSNMNATESKIDSRHSKRRHQSSKCLITRQNPLSSMLWRGGLRLLEREKEEKLTCCCYSCLRLLAIVSDSCDCCDFSPSPALTSSICRRSCKRVSSRWLVVCARTISRRLNWNSLSLSLSLGQ